jgi:hypothetical protein
VSERQVMWDFKHEQLSHSYQIDMLVFLLGDLFD